MQAYGEFMSFCNSKTREEFDKLKSENEHMREYLSELHSMLNEIIKVRKSVIERKVADSDSFDNKHLLQVKNELLGLKEADMEGTCMAAIRENLGRFREFMEKVDSAHFNTPLEKAYQFNADADIDEIKNIAKLKELISTHASPRKLQIRGELAGPVASAGGGQVEPE